MWPVIKVFYVVSHYKEAKQTLLCNVEHSFQIALKGGECDGLVTCYYFLLCPSLLALSAPPALFDTSKVRADKTNFVTNVAQLIISLLLYHREKYHENGMVR